MHKNSTYDNQVAKETDKITEEKTSVKQDGLRADIRVYYVT